jgi:hypothetical protein
MVAQIPCGLSLEVLEGSEPIVIFTCGMSDSDSGIKDTTAYKIIRQITDHIWGSDEKYEDSDVVAICRIFTSRNGSWESLMGGSMKDTICLEESIEAFVKYRKTSSIASRLIAKKQNG